MGKIQIRVKKIQWEIKRSWNKRWPVKQVSNRVWWDPKETS